MKVSVDVFNSKINFYLICSPRGLMDKASDFGSEDCRFESCRGRYIFATFVCQFCQNYLSNNLFLFEKHFNIYILNKNKSFIQF